MEPSRHPDDPGTFWDFLRPWWQEFYRRYLAPPPPTEADLIHPDAQPICPTCTEPHHPLLSRCPHCGEFVGPFNTILYLDWVYIWGRGMSDLVWRRKLTSLLRAGMLMLAIFYLVGCAVSAGAVVESFHAPNRTMSGYGLVYGNQGLILNLIAFLGLTRGLLRPDPDALDNPAE